MAVPQSIEPTPWQYHTAQSLRYGSSTASLRASSRSALSRPRSSSTSAVPYIAQQTVAPYASSVRDIGGSSTRYLSTGHGIAHPYHMPAQYRTSHSTYLGC
eukprot:25068-Rhodomonas_salina.3